MAARYGPVSAPAATCGMRARASDVEEPHVLGVALDEGPPGLHVLAHEHAEQLVCLRRVVERDLQQHPVRGVHGGVPQLVGVHLAEALEPLYAVAGSRVPAAG